jgi:hypothetical protein
VLLNVLELEWLVLFGLCCKTRRRAFGSQ